MGIMVMLDIETINRCNVATTPGNYQENNTKFPQEHSACF